MSQFYLVIDLLGGDPLKQQVTKRNVLTNTTAVLERARTTE
jgi:hypothetical protein